MHSKRRMYLEPAYATEFGSGSEWSAHVRDTSLATLLELKPGEPFLLVTRTIDHDEGRFPVTVVDTHYFLGLSPKNDVPIIRRDEASGLGRITIVSERFEHFSERKERVGYDLSGPAALPNEIRLWQLQFASTPVTRPFKDPEHLYGNAELDAITVVVGAEAIEQFCLTEARFADKTFRTGHCKVWNWYVRSARKLGLSIHCEAAYHAVQAEAREIIAKLLQHRAAIERLSARIAIIMQNTNSVLSDGASLTIVTDDVHAKLMTSGDRDALRKLQADVSELFAEAQELGMHENTAWVKVGGLSYQPAQILKDFEDVISHET